MIRKVIVYTTLLSFTLLLAAHSYMNNTIEELESQTLSYEHAIATSKYNIDNRDKHDRQVPQETIKTSISSAEAQGNKVADFQNGESVDNIESLFEDKSDATKWFTYDDIGETILTWHFETVYDFEDDDYAVLWLLTDEAGAIYEYTRAYFDSETGKFYDVNPTFTHESAKFGTPDYDNLEEPLESSTIENLTQSLEQTKSEGDGNFTYVPDDVTNARAALGSEQGGESDE